MTEETKSEAAAEAEAAPKFLLTILVDLSHESFAQRGLRARIALAEVLSGMARAAMHGADALVVESVEGRSLGVYMIGPDTSGEGLEAFKMAVDAVKGNCREVGAEVVEFVVPKEG